PAIGCRIERSRPRSNRSTRCCDEPDESELTSKIVMSRERYAPENTESRRTDAARVASATLGRLPRPNFQSITPETAANVMKPARQNSTIAPQNKSSAQTA